MFGARYDVTKPLVLARIRQDVLRWEMCHRDDFTSTTTHFVLSQSYCRQCCQPQKLFHRVRMPWIRGCGTCRKSKLLRRSFAPPGPLADFCNFGPPCSKLALFSGRKRGRQRPAPYCSQNVLEQVDVAVFSGQKHVHPKASASRSKFSSLRDHAPPSPFIFRACHDSHHESTSIPENTSFSWNGILFTQRVKGYWYGS